MKLTKKLEAEIKKVMQTYWDSYMEGDLKTWASFLPNDYRNIGTNNEEEWNSKKEIVEYTKKVFSKAVGLAELRNKKTKIIPYDPYMMVHEFGDLYIKNEEGWIFYSPLRLSSLLEKTVKGWQVLHQHGSYPDSKAEEGEAFGFNELKAENKKLKDAIKRRTKDLEDKNRELEIETTLEKVRGVAMGMHKQEDLTAIGKTIFTELKALGFSGIRNTEMVINNDEKETIKSYHFSDYGKQEIIEIGYKENPIVKKWAKDLKKAKNAFVPVTIPPKEMNNWNKYRKELGYKTDPKMARAKSVFYYSYSIGLGALSISCWQKLEDEQIKILERFRNVFNLSYQRYTDIAKAEAQTRKAQIEASLERVRSRSLAMHKTSELQDVINTVHNELLHLNIAIEGGSFITINSDIETTLRCWGSGGTADTTEEIHIPLYKKPFCTNLINRIKKGPGFFTEKFTQKEKKDFFTFLFNHEPWKKLKAKEKKETLSSPGGYTRSVCVSKHTSIFIINHHGEIFSAADNDILKRFGNVFEQSYTRFLDLQKAEAQAREAQLEAALEKIRSTSLAMHKSDELKDVILELLKKLQELGIAMENRVTAIFTYLKESKDYYQWAASPEYNSVISFLTPYIDHPVQNDIWNARKTGTDFYAKTYTVQEKNSLFKFFFELPAFKNMPQEEKKKALGFKHYDVAIAFEKNSAVVLVSHSGKQLTENECAILKRFAKVFEQSYIRFLDLQKAEAQAREAEIELALERVRARTMAMQHSEELLEVATVLFQQVKGLGVPQWNCGFNIWEPGDEAFTYYPGSPDGVISPSPCKIPLHEHPVFRRFDESRKKGIELLVYEKEGEVQKDHYQYMLSLPGVGGLLQSMLDAGFELPTFQIDHLANFAYGNLIFITYEHFPEMHQVFKRFAKVFEQTYTRFLDLQKAEASAREAQIEAALEKVRSRSLAMHKSDELNEVVSILFEKIKELQIPATAVGIGISIEGSKDLNSYVCGENDNGLVITNYRLYYFKNKISIDICNALAKQLDFFVGHYSKKEKDAFYKYLLEHTAEFKDLPEDILQMIFESQSYTITMVAVKNAVFNINDFEGKVLAEKDVDIIKRFAKVFDQAYTRFLDLQKSEASAREAQIEAALEKVRSRSMGMQKSEELKEVIKIVNQQLTHLKIKLDHAGFVVDYTAKGDWHFWVADEQDVPSKITHPYFESVWATQFNDAKEKGADFFTTNLNFEEKNKFYNELLSYIPDLPQASKDFYLTCPGLAATTVLFDNVSLYIENFAGIPYTDEENKILMRFGKVFQQTYTRFLDLQKAEEQAREGQIELGLERVRARAMAMQQSDELKELIGTVYTELTKLNLSLDRCLIWIMNSEDRSSKLWMAGAEGIPVSFYVPYHEHPPYLAFLKGWKERNTKWEFDLGGKIKKDWDKFVFANTDMKHLPDPVKKGMQASEQIIMAGSFQKFGCLQTAGPVPLGEKQYEVLNRFAKVFDSNYTRFNDLQKAEANVREAQIETALERIRARALAMHSSDELMEVAQVLRNEMKLLGQPKLEASVIHLYPENSATFESWYAMRPSNADQGKIITGISIFNKKNAVVARDFINAYKSSNKEYTLKYSGAILKEWLDQVAKQSPAITDYIGKELPEQHVYHFSNFDGGSLMMVARVEPEEEAKELQRRAAATFGFAYKRFLDLQKAEASAKEAQIEASLERVRSRSMAMHKSDEMLAVIEVVSEQLQLLNLNFDTVSFAKNNQEGDFTFWITSKGQPKPLYMEVPTMDSPVLSRVYEAKKNGVDFFADVFTAEENREWTEHMIKYSDLKYFPESIKEFVLNTPGFGRSSFLLKNIDLYVGNYRAVPFSDEENAIFKRFAQVFEQSYTRFLDLQKAEASAREAEIEASLERVRSRSMAMHKSDELREAGELLWNELGKLGIPSLSSGYVLMDKEEKIGWIYGPNPATGKIAEPIGVLHTETKEMLAVLSGWKKQDTLCIIEMNEEDTIVHQTFIAERSLHMDGTILRWITAEQLIALSPKRLFLHNFNFKEGYLLIVGGNRLTGEQIELLLRFTKVFQQTYTRFNDLQKAEAQAREATIEAALEKVRSRSLAMHTTNELSEVVTVLVEKLTELGVVLDANGVILCTYFPDSKNVLHWIASPDFSMAGSYLLPYFDHPIFNDAWNSKIAGDEYFSKAFSVEEKNSFFAYAFEHSDYRNFPDEFKQWIFQNDKHILSFAWQKNSAILIPSHTGVVPNETEKQILIRFSKVFEQAYVRFMDLQKAEASAREATIEAALERVRSQSMGMQTSKDLSNVTTAMFEQLRMLGGDLFATGIVFCDKHEGHVEQWHSLPDAGMISPFIVPVNLDYIHQYRYDQWKKGTELFSIEIPGDFIEQHFNDIFNLPSAQVVLKEFEANNTPMPATPPWEIDYGASFKHGYILASALQPFAEVNILPRFAKVFEQTYTRFLDLQKAEASAREAKIEAALEKVRSRTMAMQKGEELQDVVVLLYKELIALGVTNFVTCGYVEVNEETSRQMTWVTGPGGDSLGLFYLPLTGDATFDERYAAWKQQQIVFHQTIAGEIRIKHLEYAITTFNSKEAEEMVLSQFPDPTVFYCFNFSHGYLHLVGGSLLNKEEETLLARFTRVFEQTYARFLDLKKAEAQTREAKIEMALEKIRSRTMAMQHSDELPEAANLLFLEVQALGIPAWSAGYNILSEDRKSSHCIMSSEGEMQIPFNLPLTEHSSLIPWYEAIKNDEPFFVYEQDGEELVEHYRYMATLPELEPTLKQFAEAGIALPTHQINHLVQFPKGFLLFITYEQVPEAHDIFKRFTKVFEQTYTRFLDLKKAEAHAVKAEQDLIAIKNARQKAEEALSNLQATQTQLVQSEKMASLGELTAGIAHEIQNPLNFVNNFSEVSKELLDEIKEEIGKGNLEDAMEIMNDVIQNLEKINHHGKRADGIVKGMLQHSRSSSGTKEPTDINALADEYLRLAYHGLRAKDKSFNATMKTDFDASLEKVNVIPQDIGRVILNLITNAFYAVSAKAEASADGNTSSPKVSMEKYEPTVTVSSKKVNGNVEISVADNGNGIPQKVLDKIFQPFFTTKPTGQGTGLGLSLAFDIVTKGHGGELKVETKEGQGTEFIILLPTT